MAVAAQKFREPLEERTMSVEHLGGREGRASQDPGGQGGEGQTVAQLADIDTAPVPSLRGTIDPEKRTEVGGQFDFSDEFGGADIHALRFHLADLGLDSIGEQGGQLVEHGR